MRSKNYEKLFRLLISGKVKEVAGFIGFKGLRTVCEILLSDDGSVDFGIHGEMADGFYFGETERFLAYCQKHDLEWIDETQSWICNEIRSAKDLPDISTEYLYEIKQYDKREFRSGAYLELIAVYCRSTYFKAWYELPQVKG